jgi:hypothetical protein
MADDRWRELTPVTLEGLEAWLAARPPDEVVGTTCSANDCPVARYATELNGAESAWVYGATYGVRWRRPSVADLDPGLRRFVGRLDGCLPMIGHFQVTAAEALDVLRARWLAVEVRPS